MTLRETVTSMKDGRLGFISKGYFGTRTELSEALLKLASIEASVKEPGTNRQDEVAEKLDRCIVKSNCDALEMRDWRIVPWVMWTGSNAADYEWFLDRLFAVLSAPDRPSSAVRALVHSYVAFFDPKRQSMIRVASFLRTRGLNHGTRFEQRWHELDRRFSVFDPKSCPALVAAHALLDDDVTAQLAEVGVPGERLDDGFATRAFEAAILSVAAQATDQQSADACRVSLGRLFLWAQAGERLKRYPQLLPFMASRLLISFDEAKASEPTLVFIVEKLVGLMGDPRIKVGSWAGVDANAKDIAMRILVGVTIEDFFHVISRTAERRHWDDRRKFWLAYYKNGLVDDAWVAFGPDARRLAAKLGKTKTYGTLINAGDDAHSAIIMRIADLVIVEWSHNGRCRFYPRRGKYVPGSYAMRYDFQELHRNAPAPFFLVHQGDWQPRFANKIYQLSGVRHPTLGSGSRY